MTAALLAVCLLVPSACACTQSEPTVSPAPVSATSPSGTASSPEESPEEYLHPFDFDLAEYVQRPDLSSMTVDKEKLEEKTQKNYDSFLSAVTVKEDKGDGDTVEEGDETEIYYKGTLIVYDGPFSFTVGASGIAGFDEALTSAKIADGAATVTLTLPEDFALPKIMERGDDLLNKELAGKEVTLILSEFGAKLPASGGAVEGHLTFLYVFPGGTFDESSGATGYPLTIGSGKFIPGFESGMIGMSAAAGSKRTVRVTFPDPYNNNPALAGEPVDFEVTVLAVKTAKKFDLSKSEDFDLFKSEYEKKNGAGSLKFKNKDEIYENCREQARTTLIVDLIDAAAVMIKPHAEQEEKYKAIITEQFVMQYNSYYASMLGRMLTVDEIVQYFFSNDRQKFDDQIVTIAHKLLLRHMTVFLLAKEEGLDAVTDEEVTARLDELVEMYKSEKSDLTAKEVLDTLYSGSKAEIVKEIVTDRTLEMLAGKIKTE